MNYSTSRYYNGHKKACQAQSYPQDQSQDLQDQLEAWDHWVDNPLEGGEKTAKEMKRLEEVETWKKVEENKKTEVLAS